MSARPAGQVSFGAGIVDRDIQAAEARDSLFDKIAHVVFVAHVRQNESGLSAEATKLGFECLAFDLAAAGRNQLAPSLARQTHVHDRCRSERR